MKRFGDGLARRGAELGLDPSQIIGAKSDDDGAVDDLRSNSRVDVKSEPVLLTAAQGELDLEADLPVGGPTQAELLGGHTQLPQGGQEQTDDRRSERERSQLGHPRRNQTVDQSEGDDDAHVRGFLGRPASIVLGFEASNLTAIVGAAAAAARQDEHQRECPRQQSCSTASSRGPRPQLS